MHFLVLGLLHFISLQLCQKKQEIHSRFCSQISNKGSFMNQLWAIHALYDRFIPFPFYYKSNIVCWSYTYVKHILQIHFMYIQIKLPYIMS